MRWYVAKLSNKYTPGALDGLRPNVRPPNTMSQRPAQVAEWGLPPLHDHQLRAQPGVFHFRERPLLLLAEPRQAAAADQVRSE